MLLKSLDGGWLVSLLRMNSSGGLMWTQTALEPVLFSSSLNCSEWKRGEVFESIPML